nr:unnamed protein product [Callosobruchus chinensis]
MESIKQSIDVLRSNQESMRHEFNSKMTAFDVELQRQNKVQQEMQKDILSINKTIDNLKDELGQVNERVSQNKQNIDALKISVNMLNAHQHILFLLDKFERDQGKLYESIKKARKNEMDDEILPPAALTEMMKDVLGHLPEGHKFPFHPDIENSKYIVRTVKTDVIVYNGLIMFILETPLLSQVNAARDCEAEVFFGATAVPKSCNTRVMQLAQPLFLQLMKPNNWIYAIPNPKSLTIICGKNRRLATLEGKENTTPLKP